MFFVRSFVPRGSFGWPPGWSWTCTDGSTLRAIQRIPHLESLHNPHAPRGVARELYRNVVSVYRSTAETQHEASPAGFEAADPEVGRPLSHLNCRACPLRSWAKACCHNRVRFGHHQHRLGAARGRELVRQSSRSFRSPKRPKWHGILVLLALSFQTNSRSFQAQAARA